MEFNIGMDGDIVILGLTGDLVASSIEEFKLQVSKLTDKNFVNIMLDMSKVGFMDSSGLGSCIAVHKMLTGKDGMIVFAQPNDSVNKIFRITMADKKLNIALSKSEGIKKFHEKIISERRQK